MRIAVFNDPHRGFSTKTVNIHDKVFASIDQSLFDIVLVCGDWGTSKTDHVRGCFKAFRKAFPDKPILGVLGNHDFWDPRNAISMIENLIKDYAKESNIHLLDKNPFEKDGVLFLGFNGWYVNQDPGNTPDDYSGAMGLRRRGRIRYHTNGMLTDHYLQKKARESVDFILNYPKDDKKVVVVSHFPCVEEAIDNPEWCGDLSFGDQLLPIADFMFFGHTHKSVDTIVGKTRVINVGSGYNRDEKDHLKEYFFYKIVEI